MTTTNGTNLSKSAERELVRESYSGAWLAAKLGIEPRLLEARRRAGELLAVRPEGATDYRYPTWQFGADGEPLPAIAPLVRAAKEAGLDDRALYELLERRDGLTGSGRLLDAVREGRADRVLAVIRSARGSEERTISR